jgi:hypothetical protein
VSDSSRKTNQIAGHITDAFAIEADLATVLNRRGKRVAALPSDRDSRLGRRSRRHLTAALKMKVEDLRTHGPSWRIKLHEKAVSACDAVPSRTCRAMRAYIAAAAIAEARKGWLFRSSLGHTATALTERSIDQKTAWHTIRGRAVAAGIFAPIGYHTFRATA